MVNGEYSDRGDGRVVAGATTFTGVDQTVPLGTFVSADGARAAWPAQFRHRIATPGNVPSVVNGMVFDTLATGGTVIVTVPGPQVQQWNVTSSGNQRNPRCTCTAAAARAGAPSVPDLGDFYNGTSNWSLGAISDQSDAQQISESAPASPRFNWDRTRSTTSRLQ